MDYSACQDAPAQTGWHLNAIISADKKDSILLEYKSYLPGLRVRGRCSTAWIVRDYTPGFCTGCDNTPQSLSSMLLTDFLYDELNITSFAIPQYSSLNPYKNLSSIIFKGGRINFSYDSFYGSTFLSQMEIYDSNSVPVKKINFSYRQSDVTSITMENKAVLLDKLAIINPQVPQEAGEVYSFDYYDPQWFSGGSMTLSEMQSDWQGYFLRGGYNVISETVEYSTATIASSVSYPGYAGIGESSSNTNFANPKGTRESDMKSCILKSITYPTGGKTVYDYKSNFYDRQGYQQPKPCGGLRIKSIEKIAANGSSELKTYKYNLGQNGCGVMPAYFYPPVSLFKNFISETTTEIMYGHTNDPNSNTIFYNSMFIN